MIARYLELVDRVQNTVDLYDLPRQSRSVRIMSNNSFQLLTLTSSTSGAAFGEL